ncbi:MAG: hypothetical protein WKF54_04720 [Nocardioidaceae bacterium]
MTTTAAAKPMREWTTNQRRLAATGLLVSVPLAVLVVWLLTRQLLPAMITDPNSWWPEFEPVSSNYLRFLIPSTPFVLATLVVLWTGEWSPVSVKRRHAVIWLALVVWLQPVLFLKSMLISYGLDGGEVAQTMPWHLLACTAVLSTAIPLLGLVLPPNESPISGRPTSRLRFAPSEHIVWVGRAISRSTVIFVSTFLALGLALMFVSPPWAISAVILALPGIWRVSTRTIIDDRGVHVTPFVKWPTVTIPLDHVTHAYASTVYGSRLTTGWTWEGGKKLAWHPRSVVIRPGPTLVLYLADDTPVLLSVDQANEAADVVNALLLRREAQHGVRMDTSHVSAMGDLPSSDWEAP